MPIPDVSKSLTRSARLALRLTRAEAIIDIQKKVAALLGIPLAPSDGEA